MGIFEKFKSWFKKSASAFTTGLRDIVVKKEIDDKTLNKIEDYLIQSDVGVVAASEIREIISQTKIGDFQIIPHNHARTTENRQNRQWGLQ